MNKIDATSRQLVLPLPFSLNGKKVLISPLNWGLGHASRCVAIIHHLIEQGAQVILAGDGKAGDLLRREFPDLEFITIKSIEVKYSRNKMSTIGILLQLPRLIGQTYAEYFVLQKIIKTHELDLIVSDNRYGLWNRRVFSVVICHQIEPQLPKSLFLFQKIANRVNASLLKKFDQCWIPDFLDKNSCLAGTLSHPENILLSVHYIGALSRLSSYKSMYLHNVVKYNVLIILSGPEPQRTKLEELLIDALSKSRLRIALVRGVESQICIPSFDFVCNIASSKQIAQLMIESEMVICRSGYSSVMDLAIMQKQAILIPTPGQTEQEYLSKYLTNNNLFSFISQDSIEESLVSEILKFQSDNQ